MEVALVGQGEVPLGAPAVCGNPEASYIFGLEEFCIRRRKATRLRHLRCAMEHGHVAAAYMVGMIMLHHSPSLDSTEQLLECLERVSASASAGPRTRRRIASVRREAASVMRILTMRCWKMAEPPTPCVKIRGAGRWRRRKPGTRAMARTGDFAAGCVGGSMNTASLLRRFNNSRMGMSSRGVVYRSRWLLRPCTRLHVRRLS